MTCPFVYHYICLAFCLFVNTPTHPTGYAPTTSELSTILLPINVPLILEFWR